MWWERGEHNGRPIPFDSESASGGGEHPRRRDKAAFLGSLDPVVCRNQVILSSS
jgi:hypothetical protein